MLRPDEPAERVFEVVPNSTGTSFGIVTVADDLDEEDGFVKVTILPGDGYTVSADYSFAIVRVLDNDLPATPADVRINGLQDSKGNVTVRWLARRETGALRFDARYIREECTDAGSCAPLPNTDWTEAPNLRKRTAPPTDGNEEVYLKLPKDAGHHYRVEVQAKNDDVSGWADFKMVSGPAHRRRGHSMKSQRLGLTPTSP